MLKQSLLAAVAVGCLTLGSGCCHWGTMHGCKGGPSAAGMWYDSCDGCGGGPGVDCGPDCGVEVVPACGDDCGPACGDCRSQRLPKSCHHCGRRGLLCCWQPGALLREFFGCDGCAGPMYWSEWYNDPPNCCDACDHYGNFTGGPHGYVPGYGHGKIYGSGPMTIEGPYYEDEGEVIESPTPATPREAKLPPSRLKAGPAMVVPTSYQTPLNSKCSCEN